MPAQLLLVLLLLLLSACEVSVLNGRDPRQLVSNQLVDLSGASSPRPVAHAYYPLGLVHPRYPSDAQMPSDAARYGYYPYYPVDQGYYPDYGSGYAVYPTDYSYYPCPQGFQAFPYYPGDYREYPYYPQGYWCSPKSAHSAYYPYYPPSQPYADYAYYP